MDDIERCARLLGMKPSEVLEVMQVDGGELACTHDGVWTLIREDGELVFRVVPPTPPADPDGLTQENLEDVVDMAESFAEDAAAGEDEKPDAESKSDADGESETPRPTSRRRSRK